MVIDHTVVLLYPFCVLLQVCTLENVSGIMGRLCYALIFKAVLSFTLNTAFSAFPTKPARGEPSRRPPRSLYCGGRRVPYPVRRKYILKRREDP